MVIEWGTHPFAAPLSDKIRGWGTGVPHEGALLTGIPQEVTKGKTSLRIWLGCPDASGAQQTLLREQVSSDSSTCPFSQELSANLLLNIYCFPLCSVWCQALEEETNKQGTGNCLQLMITYQVSRNPLGSPIGWILSPIFAAGEMRLRVGKILVPGHTANESGSRVRHPSPAS